MKFRYIFGIIVLCLLSMGVGHRFYLSQYEEECYEYKMKVLVWNLTFQNYEPSGCEWLMCYMCPCELVDKVYYFNNTIQTNECAKYHLIRKVHSSDQV